MFRKEDVLFPADGGIELSAWLFVPEHWASPLPAIIMAHGYGGTKYHGIEPILGATDRRLKAVVAQVPTIDGHAAGLRRVVPEAVADLEAQFAADDRAQLRGEPPATQLIVSADTAKTSSYKAADVVSFYLRPVPKGVWENKITVRSTRGALVRSGRLR